MSYARTRLTVVQRRFRASGATVPSPSSSHAGVSRRRRPAAPAPRWAVCRLGGWASSGTSGSIAAGRSRISWGAGRAGGRPTSRASCCRKIRKDIRTRRWPASGRCWSSQPARRSRAARIEVVKMGTTVGSQLPFGTQGRAHRAGDHRRLRRRAEDRLSEPAQACSRSGYPPARHAVWRGGRDSGTGRRATGERILRELDLAAGGKVELRAAAYDRGEFRALAIVLMHGYRFPRT